MPPLIKFEVVQSTLRNFGLLIGKLEALLANLEERQEPLEKIKRRQINRWARNFDQEGKIYGAWAALSPDWTIPDRLSRGYGPGPILVRRGTLMNWVKAQNEAGDVNNQAIEWNFRASGAKDGSYAVFHHEGYHNVRTGRPVQARKIWDLDPADEEAATKEMERWINRVIARYFR